MGSRIWYRVAVARPTGTPQLFAASGFHMGDAIAAASARVPNGWPIAVELAAPDQIPLGESVGKDQVVALGDAPAMPTFRWPSGIVPSFAGASAMSGARRGWLARPESKLLAIEAQTDGEHLIDLFLGLVERLPAADNLEIRVLDHFEDAGSTDVWLTSRVNAKQVIRFLDDHDVDVLGNGHLEVSVYVRKHKATLRLTEHKTVVWLADERALEAEVTAWLGELAVPRVDALVTARDVAHFHYRPGSTKDRKKLGDELYRQRLRKVDVIPKRSA